MTAQAGRKRAAYYNSGTYASPTWIHLARISDVNRPQSRSTSDRMYRGAVNKKKVTGYKEHSFTFKYHVKKAGTADTVLDKLQDSFDNDTVLDVCFMNGKFDTGTTRTGVRGPVVVSKFDISEADEEGVTYDVELVEVEDDTIPEITAFSVTTA
jgi:hypothetical protein